MKNALITGSTKGIGLAVAKKLLEKDYVVFLSYANDDETANYVYESLSCVYPSKIFIDKVNFSDLENSMTYITAIKQRIDKLDVLVLNVGITDRSTLTSTSVENWENIMKTNVTIPFFMIQQLVDLMRNYGCIICTGSSMGIHPHSLSPSYGITKSAVHAMVKNLVKFLSPLGIRINAISPGFVKTKWQKNKPEEIKNSINSKIALHRFAESEEIADTFMHVITNSYINGAIISVDGGYSYQ